MHLWGCQKVFLSCLFMHSDNSMSVAESVTEKEACLLGFSHELIIVSDAFSKNKS